METRNRTRIGVLLAGIGIALLSPSLSRAARLAPAGDPERTLAGERGAVLAALHFDLKMDRYAATHHSPAGRWLELYQLRQQLWSAVIVPELRRGTRLIERGADRALAREILSYCILTQSDDVEPFSLLHDAYEGNAALVESVLAELPDEQQRLFAPKLAQLRIDARDRRHERPTVATRAVAGDRLAVLAAIRFEPAFTAFVTNDELRYGTARGEGDSIRDLQARFRESVFLPHVRRGVLVALDGDASVLEAMLVWAAHSSWSGEPRALVARVWDASPDLVEAVVADLPPAERAAVHDALVEGWHLLTSGHPRTERSERLEKRLARLQTAP